MSASCRSQPMSGCRRMVPVEVQGASIRMPSKLRFGPFLPLGRVGHHGLGLKRKPREIVAQPRHAIGRTVDRGDARAGQRELRGLAARRRAEIGDALVGDVAEQPRRQRGGGVLHPPLAFGKTRQHRHRALQQRAHRSGRQHFAMQAGRPLLGIGFHGDVERRFMADRGGDLARGGLAVMRDPALPAATARHRAVSSLTSSINGCALARAAAQHRVDQPGIFRGAPVRLHQPHRQVDRGVIGHVHPEDLRGADQQRALRARRVGRDAAIEQPRQHMAERAEPPQDRRHQPPHQRAVAIGQRLQSGMRAGAVELVVERAMLVQHAVKNIRCDPPRRETRHFGWAMRIVEGALRGKKHLGRSDRQLNATDRPSPGEKHLWHANMPNIRIAFMISQLGYDPRRRDLKWTMPHG